MARIEFPTKLKKLLEGSEYEAPIRALADRVGEILHDNQMPFFPDYTDHGIDHIQGVLRSEVELIPERVWELSKPVEDDRLLTSADACVLIGGTLLHDFAMYIRKDGFLELISEGSRFIPLRWFSSNQIGRRADRPWSELWEEYVREARRFSERDLTNIIGPGPAQWWKFQSLPRADEAWDEFTFRIVGEFLRRHHARLAHEIAIYGFPGLRPGEAAEEFPALSSASAAMARMADIMGVTARSHGMALRPCLSYLDERYGSSARPLGAAVPYLMGLLRVADYLQLQASRAPFVLLDLRRPRSPVSAQEWRKHQAIDFIGPADSARGILVTASEALTYFVCLDLKALLQGLQHELDETTAVLDEVYGERGKGLPELNLSKRRVYSNIDSEAFLERLKFVPESIGFTTDANLLTLLVEPLYGAEPGIGVRELVQNSVDAVREIRAWSETHKLDPSQLQLPNQDCDVLATFESVAGGGWTLQVTDRGIGMKADTIRDYFLRAGASFRNSAAWSDSFTDAQGVSRVLRAGKFGVGAFAAFLLSDTFKLQTRHASSDPNEGYELEASVGSRLIEISRVSGLPVGTTIQMKLSSRAVRLLNLEPSMGSGKGWGPRGVDWYCWSWPRVRVVQIQDTRVRTVNPVYSHAIDQGMTPEGWFSFDAPNFDAVLWTYSFAPSLSCNGIRISRPHDVTGVDAAFQSWNSFEAQMPCPKLAVLDSQANLPLTLRRYELSEGTVPFLDELHHDVVLTFVAWALVNAPTSLEQCLEAGGTHPLGLEVGSGETFAYGNFRWCAGARAVVPCDPYLISLLGAPFCLMVGSFQSGDAQEVSYRLAQSQIDRGLEKGPCVVIPWTGRLKDVLPVRDFGPASQEFIRILDEGVEVVGGTLKNLVGIVSAQPRSPNVNSRLESIGGRDGWRRTDDDYRMVLRKSARAPRFQLASILDRLGSLADVPEDLRDGIRRLRNSEAPRLYFALEFGLTANPKPESTIATVWERHLGRSAIPFSLSDRVELIEQASADARLAERIRYFQRLRDRGENWLS